MLILIHWSLLCVFAHKPSLSLWSVSFAPTALVLIRHWLEMMGATCYNVVLRIKIVFFIIVTSKLVLAELFDVWLFFIDGLTWQILFFSVISVYHLSASLVVAKLIVPNTRTESNYTSNCTWICVLAIIICVGTRWAHNKVRIVRNDA
jgi:hypothetical protein